MRDPFGWQPANGESFVEVVGGRINDVIERTRRMKPKRAIFVTHGDIRWAFRVLFEGMAPDAFNAAYNDPQNRSAYAQITHYTRINPVARVIEPPGVIWVRMIDPMNPDVPKMPWTRIERGGP